MWLGRRMIFPTLRRGWISFRTGGLITGLPGAGDYALAAGVAARTTIFGWLVDTRGCWGRWLGLWWRIISSCGGRGSTRIRSIGGVGFMSTAWVQCRGFDCADDWDCRWRWWVGLCRSYDWLFKMAWFVGFFLAGTIYYLMMLCARQRTAAVCGSGRIEMSPTICCSSRRRRRVR